MPFSASDCRSRTVNDPELEREGRSSVVSRRVSSARLRLEGVRGQAARVRQGTSDMAELPESTVNFYADELTTHGYQLLERVHSGVACEIYRVSRLQQQPREDAFSRQSERTVGIRKLPVQCLLTIGLYRTVQIERESPQRQYILCSQIVRKIADEFIKSAHEALYCAIVKEILFRGMPLSYFSERPVFQFLLNLLAHVSVNLIDNESYACPCFLDAYMLWKIMWTLKNSSRLIIFIHHINGSMIIKQR